MLSRPWPCPSRVDSSPPPPPHPGEVGTPYDHQLKPSHAAVEGQVRRGGGLGGLGGEGGCGGRAGSQRRASCAHLHAVVTLRCAALCPAVQPEPEEDPREEEDTHGHGSVEHMLGT